MAAATILIVDDNLPLARSLAELLARRSFRTLVAETAAAALRLAGRLHPDLVIADVELPDASGMDLVERLTAAVPRTPVILISAAHRERASGHLAQGIFAALGKPFDPLRLVALVHRALRGVVPLSLEFPPVRAPRRLPVRRGLSGWGAVTALDCPAARSWRRRAWPTDRSPAH